MPTVRYQTDAGVVGQTRINNESVALAGPQPAPPHVRGFWIYKSGSRRHKGLRARYFNLRKVALADIESGIIVYDYARITVLTKTAFDAGALGSNVSYKGETWELYDKKNED